MTLPTGPAVTRRVLLSSSAAVAAAGALAACGGSDPLATTPAETAPADTIVVGSANFPENVLIAQIYSRALTKAGVQVTESLSIGAREIYVPALQDGSIDLIPEYNGSLLGYLKETPESSDPDGVLAELKTVLPDGLEVLEQSDAEDKDQLVVSSATAQQYSLSAIPDLQPVAGELVMGGGPEFQTRRAGLVGLADVYGIEFKSYTALDVGGPLTVSALLDGSIQVANLFSTDPSIEVNSFVPLEDPENLFLAENVLPLINSTKVTDTVTTALNAVSAKLTTEGLTTELRKVTVDKTDSGAVADAWVAANLS